MPDPQAAIQTIVQALYAIIVLLVPILIRYYAPVVRRWIEARWAIAQTKLSADEFRLAQDIARMAVEAVDQLKKSGVILDNDHAYAKAQAITENWLRDRGILLDMTQLRAVIESAVLDQYHTQPAVEPKPMIVPGIQE